MFSPLATDHIQNRRYAGPLDSATHYGVDGEPGNGPFVEMWFRVESETIIEGRYRTYGCPTIIASCSLAIELLKGRPPATAEGLEASDLETLLGHVPEGKGDCPHMTIRAVRNANLNRVEGKSS